MIQLNLSQRTMLMPRSPSRSAKGVGMHNGCPLLNMNVCEKRYAAVIGDKQQRQEHAYIFHNSLSQIVQSTLFSREDSKIGLAIHIFSPVSKKYRSS